MAYRVHMWGDDLDYIVPTDYQNRAAAIHRMRKLAYDKLAAFAKLDTQAAHTVMLAIDRCDDILQPQESRSVVISNTGYTVAISNTKRTDR